MTEQRTDWLIGYYILGRDKSCTKTISINNFSSERVDFEGLYGRWRLRVMGLLVRANWRRANARKVTLVITWRWEVDPFQLLWYQIGVFRFPKDAPPQFLQKLNSTHFIKKLLHGYFHNTDRRDDTLSAHGMNDGYFAKTWEHT